MIKVVINVNSITSTKNSLPSVYSLHVNPGITVESLIKSLSLQLGWDEDAVHLSKGSRSMYMNCESKTMKLSEFGICDGEQLCLSYRNVERCLIQ